MEQTVEEVFDRLRREVLEFRSTVALRHLFMVMGRLDLVAALKEKNERS